MDPLGFARQLRSQQTDAEGLLWSRLRAHRLFGLKFKRQQPMGNYVADFVCFEQRLIVELDGGQHMERSDYDSTRDAWLRGQGFTVLRYWNNEALSNLDGVLEDIARHAGVLPLSPGPSPTRGEGCKAPPPGWGRGWGEGDNGQMP